MIFIVQASVKLMKEGLFVMTTEFCYLVNVFHNNNDNLDEGKVHWTANINGPLSLRILFGRAEVSGHRKIELCHDHEQVTRKSRENE